MSIATELQHIVEQAHSLARILDAAVGVIGKRHHVQGCFVYLLDEQGRLVRRSAAGAPAGEGSVDAQAEVIAAQTTAERRVATGRHDSTSLLGVPMLLRDRMVGALVLRS